MLQGVHLYFYPLLALMADAIVKFQEGDHSYGRIIVVNLDELGEITFSAKNTQTFAGHEVLHHHAGFSHIIATINGKHNAFIDD